MYFCALDFYHIYSTYLYIYYLLAMDSIPDHTLPFNALDDYNFNLAIYELQHGPVRYDPERLSSLNYDPLISSHNLSLTRSDDTDPDVNFCTDDVHCDYYIEDKFNEMLRNDNLCDEDFSLLHLNIRSLQRNLNSLSIQCFLMTSRRPYWCPKTMKRRPCWCPKLILWELYSFLMQMLSFVPINLHRCWPRE